MEAGQARRHKKQPTHTSVVSFPINPADITGTKKIYTKSFCLVPRCALQQPIAQQFALESYTICAMLASDQCQRPEQGNEPKANRPRPVIQHPDCVLLGCCTGCTRRHNQHIQRFDSSQMRRRRACFSFSISAFYF